MKVKTFHALTMQDAIRAIKEELGPDAVILSSKEVHQGGRLMSYFNKPVLEVMAAAEYDPLPPVKPSRESSAPREPKSAPQVSSAAATWTQPVGPEVFRETLQGMLAKPVSSPDQAKPPVAPAPIHRQARPAAPRPSVIKQSRLQDLRQELRELSLEISASLPKASQSLSPHTEPAIASLCRSLVAQGLRPASADRLGRSLSLELARCSAADPGELQQALAKCLAQDIRVSGPLLSGAGDRTVAIMIGTNGTGKTAAITKLAAHYRLEEKKSVAIVSLDTYRLASVEQLRMYAGVLDIPCESAMSAKQAAAYVHKHADADLILIDTAGFGERDLALVQTLHQLLKTEPEVQTHLVVSASTREQDLQRQVAQIHALPLLRLMFSKLDETDAFGALYELSHQSGIPLSYWSAGQRVPEDLEVATAQRLAELLIGRRYAVPFRSSLDAQASAVRPLSRHAYAVTMNTVTR
ncbi:MAG: flagellar biosynthesis protein FlhF [Nitrospira sp.]|nr:flagellar biosynthesis protein FlhF [Nitrospira sp.]